MKSRKGEKSAFGKYESSGLSSFRNTFPCLKPKNSPISSHRKKDLFAAAKCLAGGKTSYIYGADAGKMFVVFSQCILLLVSKTWSASTGIHIPLKAEFSFKK